MKNHTKLSSITIAMLFFASTSYTANNKGLANIVDQVGKRTSALTTQILNGGDNQQTLSSLSMQLEDTQTYLYDAITAGSGISTSYIATQLGVTTPQILTTTTVDAESSLNITNGQVSNILLSEWNPAITTTVTCAETGAVAGHVADYNTALDAALAAIGTEANSGLAIVAIRNFTYPPQANYTSLQNAITQTQAAIDLLNDALISFSAMALDHPTITSPYGLSTIYNSLGQLASSLVYMLELLEKQVQYYQAP